MNREIKFRAKTTANGNWVYGSYIYDCNCPTIRVFSGGEPFVDPKTIGQYTGLKDRNGTEIYEGDIVLYKTGYAGNPRLPLSKLVGEIKWDDKYACFSILDDSDVYETIIIGNIHDNPELLKGGEQ